MDDKTEIDLAAVLERYPELRTMRRVDVATLVEMSEFLTSVPYHEHPLGVIRERRERCNCQAAMIVLRRSELSFKYPGMATVRAAYEKDAKIEEQPYLECRRCMYRYSIGLELGRGFRPLPDGKDRVIRIRRRSDR